MTKKEAHCGELAIRPHHPRRRSEIKSCMWGDLWEIVWSCRCAENWLRGFGVVRRGKSRSPSP